MFKRVPKYIWLSFVPAIVLSAITITLLVIGTIPAVYLLATFVMWCLISGLGVAVGYHRVFSHRTHTLPAWKENILLLFGTLSGQGSSISWTAIHRGYHHPHSDTDRDPHTPNKGLWHAFLGWANEITEDNPKYSFKYAVDLLRKENHLWFHKNNLKILWSVPIAVAVIDWRLALTSCVLPAGISLLTDNLVNILGHRKAIVGYRNFETSDNSQNNLVFGYLSWGQCLHNNHHAMPSRFDFGVHWYEFDPCRLWLWLLKM